MVSLRAEYYVNALVSAKEEIIPVNQTGRVEYSVCAMIIRNLSYQTEDTIIARGSRNAQPCFKPGR